MSTIKTTFTTIFDSEKEIVLEDPKYPIVGGLKLIDNWFVRRAYKYFYNNELNRYWDCIEKSRIVAYMIQDMEEDIEESESSIDTLQIVLGSCIIKDDGQLSTFGYEFNPPYELHSWVEYNNNIIDLALPGTIEQGRREQDEFGPFITGRDPIIVAGKPPEWIKYTKHMNLYDYHHKYE